MNEPMDLFYPPACNLLHHSVIAQISIGWMHPLLFIMQFCVRDHAFIKVYDNVTHDFLFFLTSKRCLSASISVILQNVSNNRAMPKPVEEDICEGISGSNKIPSRDVCDVYSASLSLSGSDSWPFWDLGRETCDACVACALGEPGILLNLL